jgi:hypothetical protein
VTSARWQKQELIVSSDPPTLVWVQYEEAAFRLEQLKAHAGNVEEGVVGSIETACAIIFAGFENRSNRERSVAVVDRPRMMSECKAGKCTGWSGSSEGVGGEDAPEARVDSHIGDESERCIVAERGGGNVSGLGIQDIRILDT